MKKPSTLISRPEINFILDVFLEIVQRHFKFVVLGSLGIPSHAHPKRYSELVENFRVYLRAKKINFIPHAFLEILQRYTNFYFVYFGKAWLQKPEMIVL